MSNPLDILAQERDNILLAEIGAMIHNLGKMSEEHLIQQKFDWHLYFGDFLYDLLKNRPDLQNDSDWKENWKYSQDVHGKFYPAGMKQLLKDIKVSFSRNTPPFNDRVYELREFSSLIIKDLYPDRLKDMLGQTSWLGALLEQAHSRTVGADKGFLLKTSINQQDSHFMYLSTAFGNEVENISKRPILIEQTCLLLNFHTLLRKLSDFRHGNLQIEGLVFWKEFQQEFYPIFLKSLSNYLADTRQPANDVDLYGFHHAAASFFKAGIAKVLLEGRQTLTYREIEQFEWRLLSIRYNGLEYLMQARGINDMLGKQMVVSNALDEIRWFLEVEYPLANEIYRDENGAAFLFPAITDESRRKEVENTVHTEIERIFQQGVNNDLQPRIAYTKPSRQALELGEVITKYTPKFNQVGAALNSGTPEHGDLCQSCHLRFIGYGVDGNERKKARERKLCGVCHQRRDTRAANWWKQERHKTVWIDEVADEYGQVALITGKFSLEHWLNGWWLNSMLTNSLKVLQEKSGVISDYWYLVQKFSESLNYQNKDKQLGQVIDKQLRNILKANIDFLSDYMNKPFYRFFQDLPDPFNLFTHFKVTEKTLKDLRKLKKPQIPKKVVNALEKLKDREFKYENEFWIAVEETTEQIYGEKGKAENYKEQILAYSSCFADGETLFLISNAKKVSFARISRIWQQTRAFNQSISDWFEQCFQTCQQRRLRISANPVNGADFKTTHVYEFGLNGANVSFYCVKGSEQGNKNLEFVSTINRAYLEKQFNLSLETQITENTVLEEQDEKLKIKVTKPPFEDPQPYFPYIDILAEPQMFMLLVPAAQAIEVMNLIKAHYDEEFSKVKNRLPLHIGAVFAKRRQPLYTMIEAGRKMLDGFESLPDEKKPVLWKIAKDVESVDGKPQRFKVTFEHAKRSEKDNEGYMRQLEWEVSAELGDPSKTDYYYPYFYTNFTEEKDVQGRVNIFKAPLTKDDSVWHYLCHVSELKKDDEVYITPSLFDFEFLEVPGRRFDLYYEHNMRTRDHQCSRPFLLDDLAQLQQVWNLMTRVHMTNAKFRGLLEVIEKQRESWFGTAHLADSVGDESFKKFIEYTFWTQAKAWYGELSPDERGLILRYAVNGRLADVSEFFLKILKQSIEEE